MRNFNTNIIIGGRLSPSLQGAFNAVRNFASQSSSSFRNVNNSVARMNRTLSETVSKTKVMGSALVAAGTAAAGALAIKGSKSMLDQASSMEQYRNTLNIVMKDQKKAGQTFKWAVDYANKTPFETGEIVDATVKLQSYGLEAQKMMPFIGDMAAGMGKGMDQAVEAIADAQTGELERLKEFGITKQQIVDQASKKLGKMQVVNNKGQITNQRGFNASLISLMQDRFKGGMEVQAGSFKGLMSTITGVWKSGLSQMAGIDQEGLIIDGSMFDVVKDKVSMFKDKIELLQKSGKFDELQQSFGNFANDVSEGLETALPKLLDFGKYVLNNGPQIMNTVKYIGIAFLGWKTISFISNAINTIKELGGAFVLVKTRYLPLLLTKMKDMALTAAIIGLYIWEGLVKAATAIQTFLLAGAQAALNIAMTIGTAIMTGFGAVLAFLTSPIGLVILAIMALVAVGYVLWQNWDSICAFFVGIWQDYVLPFFSGLSDWFAGLWEGIAGTFTGFINIIIDGINGLIGMLNGIHFSVPDWVPGLGGKEFGINIPNIPKFAKGGIATTTSICGEAGPEAVIPLKKNNPRSIQLLQQTSEILGVKNVPQSLSTINTLEPLNTLKPRNISKNKNNSKGDKGVFNIYYQPNINCDSGQNTSNLKRILKDNFEEFKAYLEEFFEDKERVNIDESIFDI